MEMSIRFPNLNLGFDYVGKSFQIFGFEITIYGILIALGMLLGIAFVVLEAKRTNQNQDKYLDMMIISLAAAVVGARLYYVGFSWTLYKGNPMEIFNLRSGGTAFYGGLLGGVIAAALFCSICKLSFWQMADTASMGILIGQIIGRWGNFFNRESFGEYTDSIFAMQLPLTAVRSGEVTTLMRENLITEGGISYIQVHPVFLYESIWCLILLLFLLAVRRRKKFQGELFMLYLAGYGFGRFFFEYLRTDKLFIPGTPVGISMLVSAALFVILTPMVWTKHVMAKKRATARKRRREKVYEAEEQAERDADAAEQARAAQKAAEQPSTEQDRPVDAPSDENALTETNAQSPQAEIPQQEQPSKGDADADNWENSEYAHIPDRWKNSSAGDAEESEQAENE